MKKIRLLLLLFVSLFIVSVNPFCAKGQVEGIWSGKITLNETFDGLTGTSEKHIVVTILDNVARGSIQYEEYSKIDHQTRSCDGSGLSELQSVIINRPENTYSIEAAGPTCSSGPNPWEKGHGNDILVLDQPLGSSVNLLAGTKTIVTDLPGGLGTLTTTMSWDLSQASPEVELIVTPVNYDNWLPEPGPDEIRKGTVMEVSLKLRRKNGQPLTLKAKTFEIRLANTSKEPGITLNAPLTPSSNQLPDLRLLLLPIAESKNADQFLSMPCRDGSTGKVYIGSYDGGGYTTLTAEAILEDGSHIKGNLLITGGDTEIPVPKRGVGTKIAISWLLANGNPVETDDNETSNGNKNVGDGFSAYEEYRGVISQGQFQRLDPDKKDIGIQVKKAEFSLFAEGLSWFEHASDLNVIRFSENEIGPDRQLNKNYSSVHIYDQYVLKLVKGVIREDGVVGKAYGGPGLPKKIVVVKIDYNKMVQQQLEEERKARVNHVQLPFTLQDLLAKNVAHELSHGVNVFHHGESVIKTINVTLPKVYPNIHVFRPYSSTEDLDRPIFIEGIFGGCESHNQGSGDVFCVINYSPSFNWALRFIDNTTPQTYTYYQVPLIPVGNSLCNSPDGTEYNKKDGTGNNNYFGDAAAAQDRGNCLSRIKLKD